VVTKEYEDKGKGVEPVQPMTADQARKHWGPRSQPTKEALEQDEPAPLSKRKRKKDERDA
jgi:hypothetical protein